MTTQPSGKQQLSSTVLILKLPTYIGDVLQFKGFWDPFEAALHLQGVTKLVHLRSFNEHQAIEGVNTAAENYLTVVQLLHGRFYRTSEALDAHILKVLNMETSVAKERAALLSLHDKLNRQGIVFNAISRNLDTAVSERYSLDGRFELKSLMRNRRLCRHSSRFWQRKPMTPPMRSESPSARKDVRLQAILRQQSYQPRTVDALHTAFPTTCAVCQSENTE
ncbi:hypothetical protein T05_10773, partial [Trichinella murrelli]